MKKIIILLFVLFAAYAVNVNAQNLACSTYTSVYEDSVAVSGSTDATSDWFSVDGAAKLYLEIFNGVNWYSYEIDYGAVKQLQYVRISMEGSDTTVTVQGLINGENVCLPIEATAISATASYGETFTLDIGATTRYRVKFWGVKQKDLIKD